MQRFLIVNNASSSILHEAAHLFSERAFLNDQMEIMINKSQFTLQETNLH